MGGGHLAQSLQVGHRAGWVTDYLRVEESGAVVDPSCEGLRVVTVHEPSLHAETTQRGGEHGVGAAVERRGRDQVVARAGQGGGGEELSGLAAGRGHRPDPALQAGHALLEGCSGRVGDAGVDVSVLLEGEQVSGVGGVLKHETGRLVDGHRPSAGGRIRAASCVEGTGSKTPVAIGHGMECRTAPSGRSPPARRVGRTGGD